MRIAIVGMLCEPSKATEGSVSWHWAMAYMRLGHEVALFTEASQRSNFTASELASGIAIHFVGSNRRVEKTPSSPLHAFRLLMQIADWNRAIENVVDELHSFDMVHQVSISTIRVPTSLTSLGGKLVWGPLGGAHVGHTRGVSIRALPLELLRNASIAYARLRYRSRHWFRKFRGLILTTNEETARFARTLGARNVIIELSDGLQESWLANQSRPKPPTGEISLLWAGRLVGSKRPDLAIRTIATLNASGKRCAHLTICGDGPERHRLTELARRLGVDDSIEFRGAVAHSEVRELLERTDVALFTSFRDSSAPFLVEALGMGVSAVAVRTQGVETCFPREIVPGPSANIPEGQIAEQLAYWIDQAGTRDRKNDMAFAATHTWASKARRILALAVQNSSSRV
ncbi:MAG TPA: glycosyltransferase [Microbacteriaceae bacterium]|nr:glycosyltransferase [Microbacteriaceae bacterium]